MQPSFTRAIEILRRPAVAWATLDRLAPPDASEVIAVALLPAGLPALGRLVGRLLMGWALGAAVLDALYYALSCLVLLLVLSGGLGWLARLLGYRGPTRTAVRVPLYSFGPFWLSGLLFGLPVSASFLLAPFLGMLGAGVLLYLGLRVSLRMSVETATPVASGLMAAFVLGFVLLCELLPAVVAATS